MSELLIFILLFVSSVLAGISNAVAGGGTFFTFPVFLLAGLPPVVATASNMIAVWPGHVLAGFGYRQELKAFSHNIKTSIFVALAGGLLGALLLSRINNLFFVKLIPALIFFATLLFAFGKPLSRYFSNQQTNTSTHNPGLLARVSEFLFAVYGGFFGAGLGIMMMAGLHMLGIHDIQANNALKNLLSGVISTVAAIFFAFSGLVYWPYTLVALIGAAIGGLAGARIAKSLPATWLRRVVIVFGLFLSLYYFLKYYDFDTLINYWF